MFLSFTLPNRLAALGAALSGDTVIAADGYTENLFLFDSEGEPIETLPTFRPYGNIHANLGGDGYTALGGQSGLIYVLDGHFRELRRIRVGIGPIIDASAFLCGNETMYAVTTEHSVEARRCDGSFSHYLIRPDPCLQLLAYVRGSGSTAFASVCGENTRISVRSGENRYSGVLPKRFSFRGLTALADGSVLLLYGFDYIYNRYRTVYEDGLLLLDCGCDCGVDCDML